MNLEIVSFNGVSLNDGNFEAFFPAGSVMLMPEGQPGFVERSYFGPVFTYKKRQPRTLPLHVKMLGEIAEQRDTLAALFNPYSTEEYELLVRDLADNNKQWYVMATPISMPDIDGQVAIFNLWVADPIWRTKNDIETTWLVTADGDQKTIAVGGSFYAEPTFEITPTAAKSGGKAYRIFCPVYNPSSIKYEAYPLDIVNNGLDTAALIADTSRSVVLNGGVNDSVTTFDYDGETGDFPDSGIAYIDTEQFSYTGKSSTQLTGITRGANGTSAAAHLDDAVIYASKMEADGGDIQVLVDGVAVNYWLQDINDATSQIWINANLSPGYTMTNGVLIASSGAITTITLENSTANIDAINALPSTGVLMIDSELFSYTGKNVTTRQFTGVNREAFGTTAAEHTVGDYVRWIEHEIYIYHGEHDLPALTVDDDYKPCIELDSTNAEWTWDASFAEVGLSSHYVMARSASWRVRFPVSWAAQDFYDRNYAAQSSYGYYESMDTTVPSSQTSESGVTFSVLGELFVNTGNWAMQIIPGSTTGSPPGVIYIPAGFTHVAASGKRWLASTAGADWFLTTGTNYMFRKVNSTGIPVYGDFLDAFSVAAPGVTDTSDAWSQSPLDLSGTYNYLMFYPQRGATAKDGEARIEVDTVTLALLVANVPVASCGASVEYYHLNAELLNTITGEYLSIDYFLNLNTTLIINTSAKTVIDEESGAFDRGAMALSSYRHDWHKLPPGSNVLQWNEDGVVGVTIKVKRRERKL